MMSDPRPSDAPGSAAAALRALGGGVAVLGAGHCLADADTAFLALHLVDLSTASAGLAARPWPDALRELGSRLPETDRAAVESAWRKLLDGPAGGGEPVRIGAGLGSVRLGDGRILEFAAAAAGSGLVLAARDSTAVAEAEERRTLQRSLVHEVNNALGGMLANLYLALMDLPAGHPARERVAAVNDAALGLRAEMRRVAEAANAEGRRPPG